MYYGRILFRFGLALWTSQAFLPSLFPQSNRCPSSAVPDQAKEVWWQDAIIDAVEFQSDIPLSEADRAKLSDFIGKDASLKATANHGQLDPDWLEETSEIVRFALQDHGYFKASVQLTPYLTNSGVQELHYALRISAQPGRQYYLGDVRFMSENKTPLAFDAGSLRQLLKLNKGDILDVSKVRDGLQAMNKLYQSHGYIDMTAEPSFNEADASIDLRIQIDEGGSYRVGHIRVFGLEDPAVQQLQLPQSEGDVFNPDIWSKFVEENKAKFPEGATGDRNIYVLLRNAVNHTVNIGVDFRPCPGPLG